MLRVWALIFAICGCRPAKIVDSTPAPAPPPPPAASAVATSPKPASQPEQPAPRPAAPFKFASLDVPGFDPAVLAVPAEGEQVPLVVAAHGAGDTPEAQCEIWAGLTKQRALVLCPR